MTADFVSEVERMDEMAEAARAKAGLMAPDDTGPFAALKGLKLGKD